MAWRSLAIDILLRRTWWTYPTSRPDTFDTAYHWLNVCEAGIWFVLAALVFARYLRQRHSPLEVCYAAAFLLFGLTDVQEARELSSWLIWLKLLNLIVLLCLRHVVLKRYYPGSKMY
jgi:hypothetical protein